MKFILISCIALLLSATAAIACECESPTFEKAFSESSTIFSGTVRSIEKNDGRLAVHFRAVHVWKGASAEELQVETEESTARCGYSFIVGSRYVVFAGGNTKALSINLCTRTRKEEEAADDLAKLVEYQNSRLRGSAKPKTLTIYYAVVMGISKRGSEYIALIKGADGSVYTMHAGDALYDGKIEKIDRNSVTFVRKSGGHVRKRLHEVPEPEL